MSLMELPRRYEEPDLATAWLPEEIALDPKGYVLTWNTGAQLIKGYRAEEIIGKHFSQFYPP